MTGPTPSLSLALAADNREYPRLQDFINRACEQAKCSPGQRMRVQLVIEELFSNTVKYGRGGATPVSVSIAVDIRDGEEPLAVRYEDNAPKHDAFAQDDLEDELKASVTRRKVGGLGILLIRELGKNVHYEWAGGKNRVTFSVAAETLWPRRQK